MSWGRRRDTEEVKAGGTRREEKTRERLGRNILMMDRNKRGEEQQWDKEEMKKR